MSKGKIHHDRNYYKIDGREYVVYFCGKTMLKGGEVRIDSDLSSELPPRPHDHCLRCLWGKQKSKGEMFMLEHGYPIMRLHDHRPVIVNPS